MSDLHGTADSFPRRRLWALIGAAALVRLLLALFVTDFVLVDDAYITLRYARHGAEGGLGELVYTRGEAVFGVTSPLWGLVTTAMMVILGTKLIAPGALCLGVLLWSLAAARAATMTGDRARGPLLALMLFAPVFVDNAMLGMETPLFVFLGVYALAAALGGRLTQAALWTGLLVVARPEGVLFAPALLYAASRARGSWGSAAMGLLRPRPLTLLLAPSVAWITFATVQYGTFLPQSMVAKSGWNSEHYDALGTLSNLWLGLSRLTFVPFVDYLPRPLAHGVTALVAFGVVIIARANVGSGTAASRAWLMVYGTYIGFYLAGKGATEASWYAVPSSAALLLAAAPAVPKAAARISFAAPLAACLLLLSVGLVTKRAPLLKSYVDGYGQCAQALEELDRPHGERVLIGEIGVFGFGTEHAMVDVGALVSPEVLPLKNAGLSLVEMAWATDAAWLVISDIAVEKNFYPSVGYVWRNERQRLWLETGQLHCHGADKQLIRLPEPPPPDPGVSLGS